jgi:hypothetical protein
MLVELLAFNIQWETDGEDQSSLGLPSQVKVIVNLANPEGWSGINRVICDQLWAASGGDWLVADYKLEGYGKIKTD